MPEPIGIYFYDHPRKVGFFQHCIAIHPTPCRPSMGCAGAARVPHALPGVVLIDLVPMHKPLA